MKGNKWWQAGAALVVAGLMAMVMAVPSATAQEEPDDPVSGAIIGGTQVPNGDKYPFMAGLVFNGAPDNFQGQFCGGAVIAQRWVLTAAHCPEGLTKDQFKVLVDTHDLFSGGRLIPVKRIVMHPQYDTNTNENDIALLELTQNANVPFAQIPSNAMLAQAGQILTVIGWGTIQFGSNQFPSVLREVNVPVVGDVACNNAYGGGIVGSIMVCAGDLQNGGIDSCQGDSGGPLFKRAGGKAVMAGVVSFGVGCGAPGFPGVYAQVSAYVNWIKTVAGVMPPTQVKCKGQTATIVGTPGPDTLTGTNGPDVIAGLGGNDTIRGLGGNDLVCGGRGNDIIRGGPGRDRLNGEAGADRIWGENAIDTLSGGPGPDALNGGGGDDILRGDAGNDRLNGNGGADELIAGDGEDEIFGGGGDDEIRAGRDRDEASGGPGRDLIWGDHGNDRLHGGDQRDIIRGGGGNDRMWGDNGPDNLIGGAGPNDWANGGAGADTCSAETKISC